MHLSMSLVICNQICSYAMNSFLIFIVKMPNQKLYLWETYNQSLWIQ